MGEFNGMKKREKSKGGRPVMNVDEPIPATPTEIAQTIFRTVD